MTATRDPDRLLRAWLDLMPDEAPDRVIAAVLQVVETTRQVRVLPWIGRWRPQMHRLSLIAAMAVVILALAGGAMLLTSGGRGPATATPTSAPPTAGPSPSAAAATTPASLQTLWVADAVPGTPGHVLRLTITPSLVNVVDGNSQSIIARPINGTNGEFAFAATDSTHSCQGGDIGRYGFAFARPASEPGAGDMQLGLTATEDACPARKAILERTWTRVFTTGFTGGRAVGVDFDPMFMITLPAADYEVTVAGRDALAVEPAAGRSGPGIFVATRNPAGFAEPCSETGGAKIPLAPTADAFASYLDSLPGFTVQRSSVEIGGRPAVHLTVPTTISADCQRPDHRVIEWSTSDPSFPTHCVLGQGEVTDSIYLVEVGGDLYLFQWLTPTLQPEAEMAVLSTIQFIDTLPR